MLLRKWTFPLLLLLSSGTVLAAPNTLSVAPTVDSGMNQVPLAVNAVLGATGCSGASCVNNPIFVDYDTVTGSTITDVNNGASTNIRSLASGLQVNHAPYFVVAWPFNNTSGFDDTYYASPIEPTPSIISLPGAISGTPTGPLQLLACCTIVSSSNSLDGHSGWGIEFGLSVGYKGLSTNSDSNDTGIMAGLIAALAFNHSTFTPFDVHAALRQTSANWATGYDHTNFGFGSVSWDTANALSGTSAIFLEGPHMEVMNRGYYASITLFPFRTTRRAKEVVYIGGTWPAASTVNELTAAQITAAGGTLIYTSNGTDVTPTFTYAPAASGSATFYALTLDASGNGSRVEEFTPITQSFTVGAVCIH